MDKSINALPTGFKISSYELIEELGSGGFGITYKAFDSHLQTHVAIKEYLPVSFAVRESDTINVAPRSKALARDYKYGLDMFLREARTLARFRNEHIVRVIRFLEANNTAYLVMEYEHGASLAAKVHDHSYRTEENQVMSLLVEVLQGLSVVHRESILHRDIKPSNIYIRQNNSPVLLDFGSARFALGEHTMSLTTIVSPGYAPFEQYFSDGKQGPWTDFYGLGATLYWVVTGKRPVEATERIIAVSGNDPDPNLPASDFAHGRYSPLLLECIDWMLSPKVEDRPQNSESILEHIEERSQPISRFVSGSDSKTEADRLLPFQLMSRNKTILAGLALGLFALIVGAGLFFFNRQPEVSDKSAEQSAASGPSSRSGKPGLSGQAQQNQKPDSDWPGRSILQKPEGSSESIAPLPAAPEYGAPSYQYYRQQQVDELVRAGDRALAEYRLTTPKDDSAVDYYRRALDLAPDNADARAGLGRVVDAYITLAEQKWKEGDTRTAQEYLDRASTVDPGNPDILAASRRFATQPAPRIQRTQNPIARYPNIRAAKIGYRNHEISKAEYARIRDILTTRYRRRIAQLKQMYREGKITKSEYKRLVHEAEVRLKG